MNKRSPNENCSKRRERKIKVKEWTKSGNQTKEESREESVKRSTCEKTRRATRGEESQHSLASTDIIHREDMNTASSARL